MDTKIAAVLIDTGIEAREVRTSDLFGCKVVEVTRSHVTLSIAIPRTPEARALLSRRIMWEMSYLNDDLDVERGGDSVAQVDDLRVILRRFVALADD